MWEFLAHVLEQGGLVALVVAGAVLGSLSIIKTLWDQHVKLLEAKRAEVASLRLLLEQERTRLEVLHSQRYADLKELNVRVIDGLASVDRSLEKIADISDAIKSYIGR